MEEVTEQAIRDYWDANACGEHLVGSLGSDFEDFFQRYDEFRYSHESHILRRLNEIGFAGKRVLEIGLGQGADAEQMIRRGAVWSGIDVSPESIRRVTARLQIRRLPYQELKIASALAIPAPDNSFDLVFTHGVLHHIPDIHRAQEEIARVLKPGGKLIAMLYARRSINYLVSISLLRRAAIAGMYLAGRKGRGIVAGHLANARKVGLRNYLKMANFIHANTDGPLNPYSKVYDLATVGEDFPSFRRERSYQEFMHAPPLPVGWLKPLTPILGWHLWVELIPTKT
jgi:SAM-dependent methyltransferase